ncbi:5'-3'-deoxyribonucleotidase [Gryllotalpicola kribbensis]|uniref:5'-3'-deoxyribonucleotidase n=1 Tax=Gryllotalpicola kribbensis TaxID=993084 RepID=A0ABP8ANW0_9MICO
MSPQQPIVLIDLDNTTADFTGHLNAGLARLYPDLAPHDGQQFAIWGDDADRNAAIRDVISEADFFSTMPVYPGARDALIEMLRAGVDVEICTSPMTSNVLSASAKIAWVRRFLGRRFVERTTIMGRKDLMAGDLLIDDRDYGKLRVEPLWDQVYFTQPYNVALPGPHLDRWADWEQVVLPLLGDDFR